MKRPFEEIVEENADWIYRYVRSKTADRETAEDLAQEVWLRAFRAYDTYEERGMLRHWLARIASNIVRNALFGRPDIVVFSLDAAAEDEDPILSRLADREIPDPLDEVERREMIASVLSAIDSLPDKYRQVMTFRFLMDLPVDEVARRMNIPAGSVKSSTHYAIERIRRDLGIPEKEKGETTMTCEKAKNYLFMYAKGKLSSERRAEVAEHLASCPHCREIEESLEELIPHIEIREDSDISYAGISFPNERISYTFVRNKCDEYAELNADPEAEISRVRFGSGFTNDFVQFKAFFFNDEEIPYKIVSQGDTEGRFMRAVPIRLPPMKPFNVTSNTFAMVPSRWTEQKNVYVIQLGPEAYCALYLAIPKGSGSISLKQGNGILRPERGGYDFAYSARYTERDETVWVRYENQ